MISNIVTVVLLVLSFVLLVLNTRTRNKLMYKMEQIDSLQHDADIAYQQSLRIENYSNILDTIIYAGYHSKAGYKVEILTNSKATPFFTEDERGIIVIIAKENTK